MCPRGFDKYAGAVERIMFGNKTATIADVMTEASLPRFGARALEIDAAPAVVRSAGAWSASAGANVLLPQALRVIR